MKDNTGQRKFFGNLTCRLYICIEAGPRYRSINPTPDAMLMYTWHKEQSRLFCVCVCVCKSFIQSSLYNIAELRRWRFLRTVHHRFPSSCTA